MAHFCACAPAGDRNMLTREPAAECACGHRMVRVTRWSHLERGRLAVRLVAIPDDLA